MQPRSIKLFTILFFLANAVAIAGDYAFFDNFIDDMAVDPDAELSAEVRDYLKNSALGASILAYGFLGFLWACIILLRSMIAKWVLTVVTALFVGALFIPVEEYVAVETVIYVLANVLQVAAVWMLFRADSKKWFDRTVDGELGNLE